MKKVELQFGKKDFAIIPEDEEAMERFCEWMRFILTKAYNSKELGKILEKQNVTK